MKFRNLNVEKFETRALYFEQVNSKYPSIDEHVVIKDNNKCNNEKIFQANFQENSLSRFNFVLSICKKWKLGW